MVVYNPVYKTIHDNAADPAGRRDRGAAMAVTGAVAGVLGALGVRPDRVTLLKDVSSGNGNWLVETDGGQRSVLRRYPPGAGPEDLAYEHAVLEHLGAAGWVVPHPIGEPVRHDGRWYCLTRYVPGQPAAPESPAQRRRRGRDMARLDLALRGLDERIGQRPGWQPQHTVIAANAGIDWEACVRQLTAVSEWNVHYENGRLAGVIDFGLAHQDSRPYELAIARTYRAPEAADAYRAELAASGWPLSELEEAAIIPVYQAFRVDMAAWELDHGRDSGCYDLAAIERQLARTGTRPP
jgi:Ser/Thr protein kinase RdoA (MazF antagonist)